MQVNLKRMIKTWVTDDAEKVFSGELDPGLHWSEQDQARHDRLTRARKREYLEFIFHDLGEQAGEIHIARIEFRKRLAEGRGPVGLTAKQFGLLLG